MQKYSADPFKEEAFLSTFIDLVESHSNLWDTKHPQYPIRSARKKTLETVLAFVKTRLPQADTTFVSNKIQNLRSAYRREQRKILESQTSGSAAGQVYVPRLWYYDRLRFLDDTSEARPSLSTLPSTRPSTLPSASGEPSLEDPDPSLLDEVDAPSWSQDELTQEEAGTSGMEEEAGTSGMEEEAGTSHTQELAGPSRSRTESQVPPLRLASKRPRRMGRTEEESLVLIRQATQILTKPPNPQEAYATYLASKLQEMDKPQRDMCEAIFFDAIQLGLKGELTPTTKLYKTDPNAPPPPPPPPPTTTPPPEAQPPAKRGGKARRKSRK
ncbi:uncharacterized protein LOC143976181 [Lithobates pipiens]